MPRMLKQHNAAALPPKKALPVIKKDPEPLRFKVLSGHKRPDPQDHLQDHELYLKLRRMAWAAAIEQNFLPLDILIEVLPENEEPGWLLTALPLPVD